jgi:transcriptional regulator with XRE-family HTH domain
MYVNESPTLLELIKTAGTSQQELAKRLGVTPDAIRRWGKGERKPTLDKALLAAQLLNCSIERFAMACKIPLTTDDATGTGTDITV